MPSIIPVIPEWAMALVTLAALGCSFAGVIGPYFGIRYYTESQGAQPQYAWWTLWNGNPNIHICDNTNNMNGNSWFPSGFISACSSTDENVVQAFAVMACAFLFINSILLFPHFGKKNLPIRIVEACCSLLSAVSACVVIGMWFTKMTPIAGLIGSDHLNGPSVCTAFTTADPSITPAPADCMEYQRYGIWFEVATLSLSFTLCILQVLNAGWLAFIPLLRRYDDDNDDDDEEEDEVPKRLLTGAKIKVLFFITTVFTCFFPYIRLYTNPGDRGYAFDYGLWASGPLCQEQAPNIFSPPGNLFIGPSANFGGCTVSGLSFLAALSAIAMIFAGFSFILILPSLTHRITMLRVAITCTGVSTTCLIVIFAVWVTAMDPGRSSQEYCDFLGDNILNSAKNPSASDFTECRLSWRPGPIFAVIALALGGVSFIFDCSLLLGEGEKLLPCIEVSPVAAVDRKSVV